MPKKKSAAKPANKYGIQNLSFGRPGFSLEAPVFSIKQEENKDSKGTKKAVKNDETTPKKPTKVSTKNTKSGAFNNKASRNVVKPTIRKAAGRGK